MVVATLVIISANGGRTERGVIIGRCLVASMENNTDDVVEYNRDDDVDDNDDIEVLDNNDD
jgi:hypothetical protein